MPSRNPDGTRRTREIKWRLIVNSYPCFRCGAHPGRACRTDSGRQMGEPHAERAREAAARGWVFADAPPRCLRCHGALPPDSPPGRCRRCILREDGPAPTHTTADNPGPDGSYDVPLFGEEP